MIFLNYQKKITKNEKKIFIDAKNANFFPIFPIIVKKTYSSVLFYLKMFPKKHFFRKQYYILPVRRWYFCFQNEDYYG